jgi:hypothetical protein
MTAEECLGEREWMLTVLGGECLLGNPDWVLGDEDRYRREREERARHQAEFNAKWDAQMAEAVAEGHDAKTAGIIVIGRVMAELARQVA